MKWLFWALVHVSTVFLAITFLIGYFNISPQQSEAQTFDATTIRQDIQFDIQSDMPDPNQILDEVNAYRQASGLQKLYADPILAEEARARTVDMSRNHYYSHQDTQGKNFFDHLTAKGIAPAYACENLALDSDLGIHSYIESWKNSAVHDKCLLNQSITRAGYSVTTLYTPAEGADKVYYIVVAIHGSD